jgi:hypothetical protein
MKSSLARMRLSHQVLVLAVNVSVQFVTFACFEKRMKAEIHKSRFPVLFRSHQLANTHEVSSPIFRPLLLLAPPLFSGCHSLKKRPASQSKPSKSSPVAIRNISSESSTGVIFKLLLYCDVLTGYHLFESLTGDEQIVQPAQEWLRDLGLASI